MSKGSKMAGRSPRRQSEEHIDAIKEIERPDKYAAFHVRLTKTEAKILKQKLLDMGLTGTQWLRQFINS